MIAKRNTGASSLALALVVASCAPAAPPAPRPPVRPPAAEEALRSFRPMPSSAPAPAPASSSASPAAPTEAASAAPSDAPAAPPTPEGPFPPAAFSPPHERTAKPGDGAWTPMSEGAGTGGPALYRSTVHPDTIKGWVEVTIVAVDRARVDLRMVAGTDEPKSDGVPKEHRPGLVAPADLPHLIAVFNGGFMAHHGAFGMRVGDDRFLPPRDEACTIGLESDGRVRIAPWTELADAEASFVAWRQTPPCLVTDGKPSELLASRPKLFGGAENGEHEIRRSALGVDASGRTLFYAHGEWTTANALGDALAAAGVASAAELDINWSYTRFVLYAHGDDGAPLATGTLVPKTKYGKRTYVERAADRDFFYLVARTH